MTADHPTSLSEVKEWIARHREPLLALLDQLPPEQRDELRDPAGWAPKDHLAHLTMWERSMLYLLTRRPRHEGLGIERDLYLSHDVDAINDVIYHQHRDRDWESVRAGFDAVHGELLATLDEIRWEGLMRPYSYYAPDEPGDRGSDPVGYWIAGNTYYHYDDHRRWIEELLDRSQP